MHRGGGGGGVRGVRKELQATATAAVRKGPWMAEEDAVLMDYVKRYGPRDWSSIRSKGLLPRTGKSCRLRWVNKLKPDLKTGCKFSAEEEQIVIDLQARFGNKWARIATNLPGRTDNDVKNFWSTRQKRLARLLQTPLPARSQGKQVEVPMSAEMSQFEPNVNSGDHLPRNHPQCLDLSQFTEECPGSHYFLAPYVEDPYDMKAVQMPLLESAITDHEQYLQSSKAPPQPPFDHSLLDSISPLSEGQDLILEFGELSLPCPFGCAGSSQSMELPLVPTLFDLEVGGHGIKMEDAGPYESFFGEFPLDMFEWLDQPSVPWRRP